MKLFFPFCLLLFVCGIGGCSRKQILRNVQSLLHIHPANVSDPAPPKDQTEIEIVEDIVEDAFDIAEDHAKDIIENSLESILEK